MSFSPRQLSDRLIALPQGDFIFNLIPVPPSTGTEGTFMLFLSVIPTAFDMDENKKLVLNQLLCLEIPSHCQAIDRKFAYRSVKCRICLQGSVTRKRLRVMNAESHVEVKYDRKIQVDLKDLFTKPLRRIFSYFNFYDDAPAEFTGASACTTDLIFPFVPLTYAEMIELQAPGAAPYILPMQSLGSNVNAVVVSEPRYHLIGSNNFDIDSFLTLAKIEASDQISESVKGQYRGIAKCCLFTILGPVRSFTRTEAQSSMYNHVLYHQKATRYIGSDVILQCLIYTDGQNDYMSNHKNAIIFGPNGCRPLSRDCTFADSYVMAISEGQGARSQQPAFQISIRQGIADFNFRLPDQMLQIKETPNEM